MFKKIIFITSMVLVSAPYLALAATSIPYWPSSADPLISCSGDPVLRDAQGNITGPNPKACTSFCNIIDTSKNIIYFVMTIALFAATPILFAWGGIVILTAGANPGNIETGKKILTGTVIGVVIILLAFVIIKTLATVVGVGLPGFTSALSCHVP